jgi:hypothetical protein
MQWLERGAVWAAAWAAILSGCSTLPPLREASSLPRPIVMARIKCELVTAVIAVAAKQSSPNYIATMEYFNIPDFSAAIVLQEQADSSQGVVAGGHWQNTNDIDHNTFTGGSGDFRALGLSGTQQQYNSASRAIRLSDIVEPPTRKGGPYNFRDRNILVEACSDKGYTALTQAGGSGVGRPLGITERLTQVLDEIKEAPAHVTEQKMHFEFTVVVSAGGTVSFMHPISHQELGAGGRRALHEQLDIVITRNARD